MQVARIKLMGKSSEELDKISNEIREIAKKLGIDYKGPIPLPTKRMRINVLKTPSGDGTGHGNATWDKMEMRIHKRILDVQADDRVLRQIMRVDIPQSIKIEIKLLG